VSGSAPLVSRQPRWGLSGGCILWWRWWGCGRFSLMAGRRTTGQEFRIRRMLAGCMVCFRARPGQARMVLTVKFPLGSPAEVVDGLTNSHAFFAAWHAGTSGLFQASIPIAHATAGLFTFQTQSIQTFHQNQRFTTNLVGFQYCKVVGIFDLYI